MEGLPYVRETLRYFYVVYVRVIKRLPYVLLYGRGTCVSPLVGTIREHVPGAVVNTSDPKEDCFSAVTNNDTNI
jgi:hypothetical protein